MNFLAHLALAGPSDASLVGNLLGDFAKGTEEHLLNSYPEEVVAGILMHRSIDRFTDTHAHFKQARELLSASHKRFAGVVVDIFYDHFLSLHWEKFHTVNRELFIRHSYTVLTQRSEWHPEGFSPLLERMIEQDWLGCYIEKEGIETTLQRVSQRGRFTAPIATSYGDFQRNYRELENLFLGFYPYLLEHAEKLLTGQKPQK